MRIVQILNLSLSAASQLCLLFGGISVFCFGLLQQSPATLMAFFFFGTVGYLAARHGDGIDTRLFLLVYGFSVFTSIIIFYIYSARYGLPYIGGGSDDLAFDNFAGIVARNLWYYDASEIGLLIDFTGHNSKGYIYLVSLLVRFGDVFGGYNTMISRLFNCSLLALAAVLTRSIAKQIDLNPRQALMSSLWVGLFPMMVFVAGHTFRDILIAILLLLALKAALTISTRRDYFMPALCTIAFVPLATAVAELRFLYIFPLTAMLALAWLSRLWQQERLRPTSMIVLVIAALIVVRMLINTDLSIVTIGFETLEVYSDGLIEGTDRSIEGGLSGVLFSLPAPWQFFARLAYALVTPLPIYYPDIEWNILGLGAIAQLFFAIFVIYGIKMIYRDIKLWPLLCGFLIIFFSYTMGSFIYRQITAWLPFAALLGVIGYEGYRHHRKAVFVICTVTIGLVGFMYIYLKM